MTKHKHSESAQQSAKVPVFPMDGEIWKHVTDALQGIRFGQVTFIFHEGNIVQIERTERRKIN